jgi:pimeloyl-ACP methyl ester carboxylesterase
LRRGICGFAARLAPAPLPLEEHMTFLRTALLLIVVSTAHAQSQPYESKFATVYGAKIHYVEAGSGPVLVLVHGLADDTTVWQEVIAPLAKTHRVIVPDLIGWGKSDKPLLSYRIATFSDFLDRFLQQLNVQKATFAGNSMGGWVVTDMALRYPERVEKLIIVGGVGFASVPQQMGVPLDAMRFSSRADIRKFLPMAFADKKFVSEETVDFLIEQRVRNGDGHTIATVIESMKRKDDVVDGKLAKIKAPTLVVWGRQDFLTPLVVGRRFQREIPGAKLEVIDQCGHMPQQECPAQFVEAVTPFLTPAARR